MEMRLGPARRPRGGLRRSLSALPVLVALAGGCAPEGSEPESEEPAEGVDAEAVVAEQASPELRRFLPDEMRRSTRPETFPHDAHVEIDCAVCHEDVAGHTTHGELSCADCHRASALTSLEAVSPEECLACHHAVEPPRDCGACHGVPDPVVTELRLELAVWEEPRTRALPFDHAVHGSRTCETCHRERPGLEADTCVTCHSEHHTVERRCAACHVAAPEGAHDVEVHLGCGGAGCHTDDGIARIAESRPVCLSCHVEQEEHEPDGVCTECHVLRGGPSGLTAVAPGDGRASAIRPGTAR